MTYIPIDFIKNKKNCYIFNILDHFSKFLISYIINNKYGKTIAEKLSKCFEDYGVGSDNGTVFINKHVKKLLEKKKFCLSTVSPIIHISKGLWKEFIKRLKQC